LVEANGWHRAMQASMTAPVAAGNTPSLLVSEVIM
jgi:hypothetical protein